MAVYKPPQLKRASEFLTNKKVKNSTPEAYYNVTSQKLGLYDPDTAYKGSQREKQEKESEKRLSMPKVNLNEIRDNSYYGDVDFLSPKEVSENNREIHRDAGYQEEEKKGIKLPFFNSTSQEGKPRATLGVSKTPQLQKASLQANGKTVYNQNQAVTNTSGNQLMTDADMKSSKPKEGKELDIRFRKDRAESLARAIKDVPRNLGAGVIQALDTGAELLTLGQHNNAYKPRTEEDWKKADTPFKTYDEYLANIDKLNEGVAEQKGIVERIASKVTEETTFAEKAIRAAALNLPSSFLTAGMGGLGAGVAQGLTKNKIIIEGARNLPLFSSGLNSGLEQADQIGLTGAKKYSYGIASGIIETATERMSMLGFEGQLMGKATKGAVGGFGETLRGLIEEPLTEGLNSVAQQVLTGAYTSMEDFELDMEEIQLSMASAFIMSGVNVSGTFRNGMKYRTVGVENGMVLVETQDGRVEPMSPEIVAKHQLEMTRPEYENVKKAYMKQNMAEMFEQYSNDETQTNIEPTMPIQELTKSQETFEPETEVSTPKEVKPLTEPLNEQKEVSGKAKGDSVQNVISKYTDDIANGQRQLETAERVGNKELKESATSLLKETNDKMNAELRSLEVEKVSDDVEVKAIKEVAKRNATNIESLNVSEIGVDPKRFQFKADVDAKSGAGNQLEGTDTFNSDYAGTIQVWRDKNGKDWVINGHHRVELARRAGAKNINAKIFYETDGIDPSRARQIAAEQNIAEGNGTSKDAALIFRETGYDKKDLAALGLSIKNKFIEQAYNISKLNDRIWDYVVSKKLKENQASMIGETFPNDSDKQNAVMDYINEEGSVTDAELKEVIDGIRFSETNYEEQYTLMGLETVAKSNFKEKVKLTTRIKQSIGSEKSAFGKLVKAQSAKKIESAGNILNQEANESRLDLLQNINEIIDFGKNREGDPINIILNKYANEIQNGAKLNTVVDKAIEDITGIVQDGGYLKMAMSGMQEQSNQQMMIGEELNETQQNEPSNVEGIDTDSERAEIEGQGSFFDIAETEVAKPEVITPTVDDGKSIKAKDMETRMTAEAKLENMIEKKLIGSSDNRKVAEKLNKEIVELGGKDRAKDFQKITAPKMKETITVKGEDLVANNMAIMDSDGESDVLYPGEGDRVFKTRQTKETLMNSEKIDDTMKDRVIADDPNLYETRKQRDVKMEVVTDIQRNGYDTTLKEIYAQRENGSDFNTDYDQETLITMMLKTQEMRKSQNDNGYYQEQFDKLYKIYSESGTEVARGLAIRGELATTPIGKAIASKGEVEKHRTTEQKEIAGDIDKVVEDIFGKDNLADPEKAAEAIQKKFKVPKKWIEQLKKDIADESLTKTQVKERLAEQLKVPTLTEAEFDEITEIADKLDKLDPKSETYEKEAKELTGKIREMVDRKNITFWQKVSSVQTMAMLMNVKTTLRNEIGNFLGFGTGQLDDVFSYVFDMPIKALTNKQGTLKPAINPKNYGWWKNTKKSFELLNDQTTSDVDNKYQKKRVFVPGSKMGKLEGILAVMLSDTRHKQSRIDMMEEQIKATEQYAKDKGLDFDAEGFRSEMNYYADYNTFNFDSKMAQWLDKIVKETNLKMTPFISNKDFGTGTLLAKFAKTPMNIIQYQLDHIGADLLREGVRTSRLAKKYGMKNAITMNQTRISRSLGKTATGMTYIMLGTLLSNAGAFIDEEEDKDTKALLQANGINGGYFNFSALRRSLTGGESKYQEGDSTISINWMLPVAPFLLLGSRLSKAKDEQEADTILEGLQSAIEAVGSSASDFAELPFNRTLGILTSPYYSGMDKFNQILSGAVTGFVPSPLKQLAQGIDPTSKKYSKNTAVAFGQQVKATLPGLRNTVPNRFDITGETMRFTDNETMVGDIFEMFLNPAYTDTVSDDPTLSTILKAKESGKLHTLPKVSNDYFSYNSERYDMTPEEHQQYQKDYFEAYKKYFKTKKDGAYVDAHTLAAEQAKMNYMRKNKIKFQKTESGRLKTPTIKK